MRPKTAALGAPPGNGDFRDTRPGPQLPERCCRAVAQHRLGSGGEYGAHPATPLRNQGVTHRVHTAVERVQTVGGDAVLDLMAGGADRQQLPPRDDAVLARRQDRDRAIQRAKWRLCRQRRMKFNHGPNVAGRGAREMRKK